MVDRRGILSVIRFFRQSSTRPFDFYYSARMHLQFGDPDKIVVQCAVEPNTTVGRELWLGRVWLTADGQVIGNVEDRFQEQIGIALGALLGAAQDTGKRQHHLLKGLSAEAALDLVMWAVFGDDAVHPELTGADRRLLARSEIISSKGGPAFDDWEGIIVESGDSETIVWRREQEQAQTRTFPLGTFWAATELAQAWLRSQES